MGLEVSRIEERIDRVGLGAIEVSDSIGGAGYRNLSEMLEFGKMMATTTFGVPKHLRGEVGGCVRVVMQAMEWRMSPFAVADKSYLVNDKIAYESQLIHAVVESRAPLKQRLRFSFEGDGDTRVCIVTGHIKGEVEPLEYRSPLFSKITPKNSPLWKTDPDQQLIYYSVRAWARRFVPDVLMGIYSRDELEDSGEFTGSDKAKDVTPKPKLAERLKGGSGKGFDAKHIEAETTKPAADTKPAETVNADPVTGEITEDPPTPGHPEALEMGREHRRQNRARRAPPELAAEYRETFLQGWDDQDAEMQKAGNK